MLQDTNHLRAGNRNADTIKATSCPDKLRLHALHSSVLPRAIKPVSKTTPPRTLRITSESHHFKYFKVSKQSAKEHIDTDTDLIKMSTKLPFEVRFTSFELTPRS